MPELDGIRGLAILGVLCSHGAGLTGILDRLPISRADALLSSMMVPLWGGVDLFFTLSGFLITGILLRTKNSENYFSSFYGRRMLRIFPIYYLVLIFSLTAGHFSSAIANYLPPTTSWKVAYFAYLQNWPAFWHGAKVMGGVWGAYWSLAVEEQFYLVWPIIVLLSSEKTIARICYVALALPLRFFLYYRYFGDNYGLAQLTSSRCGRAFYRRRLFRFHVQTQETSTAAMDRRLRKRGDDHFGLHSVVSSRGAGSNWQMDDHRGHIWLRIDFWGSGCVVAAPYPVSTACAHF
jgi:peptidoglycan/LPS O-acetylase OafA/YrhL